MHALAAIKKMKAAALRNRKLMLPTLHQPSSTLVIEDLMTIDKVRSLEGVFSEFERKNKCCMDKYDFRHVMREVGGDHVTDRKEIVSVGCSRS